MSGRAAGTALVVLGLVATLAALLVPVYFFDGNRSAALSRSGWQDDGKGVWDTQYGPVNSLDRYFMQHVRSEGLWEVPAGRAAQKRSALRSVRTVGDHLVESGSDLDKRVIKAARTLKVTLPNQPTSEQQQYLDEIENARGRAFDQLLVNHSRKQKGVSLNLVGLVRDQTRNSMVRSLATRYNNAVLDDLSILEDTGIVKFDTPPKTG